MSPRDCFGIVVRSVGLLLLLFGLYSALSGLFLLLVSVYYQRVAPLSLFVCGVLATLVSLYLLRGAPALVRFCYPAEASASGPQPNNALQRTGTGGRPASVSHV